MAYRGRYKPRNIKKYKGNPNNIEYRSLWELHFMQYCDSNSAVIAWNSEEVVVPYISTSQGNKRRRYFMDFYVKYADGSEWLFEIKPKAECKPPRKPKQGSKVNWLKKLQTFQINVDKWRAAKEYAEVHGWGFKVLNEDGLAQKFGIMVNR